MIRLSFGGGVLRNREELDEKMRELIDINQQVLGITCVQTGSRACFAELLRQAHAKTGQRVVVLVDEYDKPMLDNILQFDVLLLFHDRLYKPHWFDIGTPNFLVDLLKQRQTFTPDLERLVAAESLLSSFDVDFILTEALLFQAGYLSIDRVEHHFGEYRYLLRYPNHEVYQSLANSLLHAWTGPVAQTSQTPSAKKRDRATCCWPTTLPPCKHCSPPFTPTFRTNGSSARRTAAWSALMCRRYKQCSCQRKPNKRCEPILLSVKQLLQQHPNPQVSI